MAIVLTDFFAKNNKTILWIVYGRFTEKFLHIIYITKKFLEEVFKLVIVRAQIRKRIIKLWSG